MRLLHAIHDFLPRHRAGSEIYAFDLCRALAASHHVTVVCAEYDPAREHGQVAWRVQDGIPVVEIVNNWSCRSFAETYRPPLVLDRLAHVLRAVQPDVVHVHSLLNLSLDLPALAKARGVPVVVTLHDHSLACPSGGQRIHRAEAHVCRQIDPGRCARCFRESPWADQAAFARVTGMAGNVPRLRAAGRAIVQRLPGVAAGLARAVRRVPAHPFATLDAAQIDARLDAARETWRSFDLVVAPSRAIADEFAALGFATDRVTVSDYGVAGFDPGPRPPTGPRLRLGFVGTLAWHKGAHALVDAIRALAADRVELAIFGDPAVFRAYAAELEQRAAGLPVRFAGAFDRAGVADAYAAIDVLVVPSLWLENSPLVIHEAFIAGVPVVAARIGGIPELVTDGVNGLLYEPDDESALADALRRFVVAPDLAARLAQGIPAVKSISTDAREWDARYRDVRRAAGTPIVGGVVA